MIDWNSPETKGILRLVMQRKPRRTNNAQAVEIIMLRHSMFWYRQLVKWAEQAPPEIAEASRENFQEAARLLCTIVDNNGCLITGTRQEQLVAMLRLMDFGKMTQNLRDRFLYIVPASFDVVLDLVLGNDWERRMERVTHHLNKEDSPRE